MSEFPDSGNNFVPIGDVASISRGTINPSQNPLEIFNYYSIPGYDSTGGPSRTPGKEIQSNKTILEGKCVLISKLNPRIPRVCIANTTGDAKTICSTEFIPLVPRNQGIDLDYIAHYLRSPSFQEKFQAAAGGSTNSHSRVTPNEILDWEIFVPPLPEQKKIAEILSGIDKRKELLKKQREKLQVAYKALSGELLGSLPSKVPLGDICDLQVGFPFRSADFSDEGVRLLRGENVGYGVPNWERAQFLPNSLAEASSMYQVSAGDIVIGMDRSFTKSGFKVSKISSADLPCLLVQRVGRFAPKSISTNFLWHILQSPDYQRVLLSSEKGMDIPHLSKGEVLEPLVPVADTPTQERISNSLDSMLKSIHTIDVSIAATSQLGAALQSDLLSGRKRVSV